MQNNNNNEANKEFAEKLEDLINSIEQIIMQQALEQQGNVPMQNIIEALNGIGKLRLQLEIYKAMIEQRSNTAPTLKRKF